MIVKYSKKFPYAPYLNEDIGFEMEIPDDGDPLEELKTLKGLAEKFHKDNNPGLSYDLPQGTPSIPSSIDYRAKERVEKMIDDATTHLGLAQYWEDAIKHGVTDHYNTRLKQLS